MAIFSFTDGNFNTHSRFSRPVPAPRRRLPPTPHRGQKDYRSPRLLPQIPADKHYPDYYDSDYTGLNL